MVDVKDRVNATIDTAGEKSTDLTDQAARVAKSATDNQLTGAASVQCHDGGLMDTLKDNAESAIHSVGDLVSHARDRIGASAAKAGEKVQHWAEDAYDASGNFRKEVARLVRKHPIQSVLIGIGVGLGVGLLVGRVVRV
jgi:ElaB/YqjD/DUF883 family membrane-anchored ribosome-binding protein